MGLEENMNTPFSFVLGLLCGLLLGWFGHLFYWRTRLAQPEPAYELPDSKAPSVAEAGLRAAAPVSPDDLKIIKGIGPVIERKLNEAGITTFEQLGRLTTADLRRILGNVIERLADEESLLKQARDLARR